MKVKPLQVYGTAQVGADPAQLARNTGLVDNHAPEVRGVIGAWRWRLIDKHAARIKELVQDGYTIDLGGAAAPVGYGAVIVDYLNPHDEPRSLWDVPAGADCIFASHVLEHFVDVDNAMASIAHKLKLGGHLIVQVPGWTKQNLRPAHHPYHQQMFCFAWETNAPATVRRLDDMVESYGFAIELTDTVDGNMLLIAYKL